MKYIIYTVISTLIFIFQTTLCQYIKIAGVIPNIMLLFIVSFAFFNGESEGLFIGVLMGLMQDSFFGHLIGVNIFLYGAVGYCVGCISLYSNKDNIAVPVILSFIATVLYDIGFYILNIVLKGYTSPNAYILINLLPELVYNTIAAFAVYAAVYTIGNRAVGHRF